MQNCIAEQFDVKKRVLIRKFQLDYLQAFAKSVPDKAWRKVDSPEVNKNNNKNMPEDKKEETDETTKSVSLKEFNALQKAVQSLSNMVSKGFDGLVKAMDTTPKDTTNPDKAKADEAEQQKAKAMDADAEDQANPNKKKPEDESAKAKAEESETDETKKAKEDTKDDTYDIETLNRSIKSIEKLTKTVEDMNNAKGKKDEETEETEKAEDKEEEETEKAEDKEEEETTTKAHPLDLFVVKITKAMEAMVERMEKSGTRILGFEKEFIDKNVKNNPEVQAELMKLLKVPGFKKSVSRSVPYMVTKDGRSIPFINVPQETLEKSDKEKNFKDLYKTKYSSTAEAEQQITRRVDFSRQRTCGRNPLALSK